MRGEPDQGVRRGRGRPPSKQRLPGLGRRRLRGGRDYRDQRRPVDALIPAAHIGRQVISTLIGMSFFTGIASRDGGSILKSVSVAGMLPVIQLSLPCASLWNGTCL